MKERQVWFGSVLGRDTVWEGRDKANRYLELPAAAGNRDAFDLAWDCWQNSMWSRVILDKKDPLYVDLRRQLRDIVDVIVRHIFMKLAVDDTLDHAYMALTSVFTAAKTQPSTGLWSYEGSIIHQYSCKVFLKDALEGQLGELTQPPIFAFLAILLHLNAEQGISLSHADEEDRNVVSCMMRQLSEGDTFERILKQGCGAWQSAFAASVSRICAFNRQSGSFEWLPLLMIAPQPFRLRMRETMMDGARPFNSPSASNQSIGALNMAYSRSLCDALERLQRKDCELDDLLREAFSAAPNVLAIAAGVANGVFEKFGRSRVEPILRKVLEDILGRATSSSLLSIELSGVQKAEITGSLALVSLKNMVPAFLKERLGDLLMREESQPDAIASLVGEWLPTYTDLKDAVSKMLEANRADAVWKLLSLPIAEGLFNAHKDDLVQVISATIRPSRQPPEVCCLDVVLQRANGLKARIGKVGPKIQITLQESLRKVIEYEVKRANIDELFQLIARAAVDDGDDGKEPVLQRMKLELPRFSETIFDASRAFRKLGCNKPGIAGLSASQDDLLCVILDQTTWIVPERRSNSFRDLIDVSVDVESSIWLDMLQLENVKTRSEGERTSTSLQHDRFRKLKAEIKGFGDLLKKDAVTPRQLSGLDEDRKCSMLSDYLHAARLMEVHEVKSKISSAKATIGDVESKLDSLLKFVEELCNEAHDYSSFAKQIEVTRQGLIDKTVSFLRNSESVFSFAGAALHAAIAVQHVSRGRLFSNIWRNAADKVGKSIAPDPCEDRDVEEAEEVADELEENTVDKQGARHDGGLRRRLSVELFSNEVLHETISQTDLLVNMSSFSLASAFSYFTGLEPDTVDSQVDMLMTFYSTATSNGKSPAGKSKQSQVFTTKTVLLKNAIRSFCSASRFVVINTMFGRLAEAFGLQETDLLRSKVSSIVQRLKQKEGLLSDFSVDVMDIERACKKADLERVTAVVEALSRSSELIAFLRHCEEQGWEGKDLIDSVEEHSTTFVQTATVSDFIYVKSFLDPIVRSKSAGTVALLLELIVARLDGLPDSTAAKLLINRIENCGEHIHSLKQRFRKIANREELTREFILKFAAAHRFSFKLDKAQGRCRLELSCGGSDVANAEYEEEAIFDFKSRALLLMHSELAADAEADRTLRAEMQAYVAQLDMASSVAANVSRLVELGHFHYEGFLERERHIQTASDAEAMQIETTTAVLDWMSLLNSARDEFFFLTFFFSEQLRLLDRYVNLKEETEAELLNLLRFVHSDARLPGSGIASFQKATSQPHALAALDLLSDLRQRVHNIGRFLENCFSTLQLDNGSISCSFKAEGDCHVAPGSLFVASVERQTNLIHSYRVPEAIMQLFHANAQRPQRTQVLICDQSTSWEETELFFGRACRSNAHPFMAGKLFCAVYVEKLASALQNKLISFLKAHIRVRHVRLALLVCDVERNCLILDELAALGAKHKHHLKGLPDDCMKGIYGTLCPNVRLVASDGAGLGKTEYLREQAFSMGFHLHTIPVSGPISRQLFIQRLTSRSMESFERLHLDISALTDYDSVNTLIFELVVLRTVAAGVAMMHLIESEVFIELGREWFLIHTSTCATLTL
jgi:hypothetical protein